ncbi:hypothetical protein ACLMJK_007571 [Lecanora helva]
MHTQPSHSLPFRPLSNKPHDTVYEDFHTNSSAPRINTDAYIIETIRAQYPSLHVTASPTQSVQLLAFAASGNASATPVDAENNLTENLKWRLYQPPARRLNGGSGSLADYIQFGKYLYKWDSHEYILYNIMGSDGPYPRSMTYLLGPTPLDNDKLLLAAGKYAHEIHDSVLVFDGGYWQQSRELWLAVQDAHWSDVILAEEMKKSIVGEIEKFFNSRERYQRLRVPWKRGLIFHGPPGNGKTISIKAMMHTLYQTTPDPIPTLYVRSLNSFAGPEYSLSAIFTRARATAPCLLVFEDLDSIVTDNVRSYFLNEVDGLRSNDGILMVGSTNHLERLDPGIRKRPSRFDRKYLFPEPNLGERVQYCEFWRKKLLNDNDNNDADIPEFPAKLVDPIARITDGFSFAYIQEAFVAALLAIANGDADEYDSKKRKITIEPPRPYPPMPIYPSLLPKRDDQKEELEKYVLWREIKKVVKTLREELGDGSKERAKHQQPSIPSYGYTEYRPVCDGHNGINKTGTWPDPSFYTKETGHNSQDSLPPLPHGIYNEPAGRPDPSFYTKDAGYDSQERLPPLPRGMYNEPTIGSPPSF